MIVVSRLKCDDRQGSGVKGKVDVGQLEALGMAKLTDRQTKLMWMVAQGMTDKEIAAILGLAVSTVKNTMRMIYEKLEARNRAQAVYRFCYDSRQ